jgi:flagellar basal body rod protein FlgG
MKVSEHRQTLLAHNMAHAQTTGFKQDLAVVAQRRIASRETSGGMPFGHPTLDALPGGVHVLPPHPSLVQGPIETTGRALDVALDGDGFIAVSDGESTRYTRDGNFSINRGGELVLGSGGGRWKVLDESGSTIGIQEDLGEPLIGADGTIRQGDEKVARLKLVDATDRSVLRKVGENLFDAGDAEMTAAKARLVPEALERSNFEVMSGLAQMIEAGRVYEFNATMIRLQDEATGQAVSRVGRVA